MTTIMFTVPGTPGVVFREIAGFDGYVVGDDGSVWSRRSLNGQGYGPWHRLQGEVSKGYLRVTLRDGRVGVRRQVHRLVLSAFECEQPELEARHLNGNRLDNRLGNLAWGTAFDNAVDRERHGNTLRGERHGRARITADEVREIRALAAAGANKTLLAQRFGLGRTSVGHIVQRRNWRHVP